MSPVARSPWLPIMTQPPGDTCYSLAEQPRAGRRQAPSWPGPSHNARPVVRRYTEDLTDISIGGGNHSWTDKIELAELWGESEAV